MDEKKIEMLFKVIQEEMKLDGFVFLGRKSEGGPLSRCVAGLDSLQLFAVLQMSADEVRDGNRMSALMSRDEKKPAASSDGHGPEEPKEDGASNNDSVVGESPAGPIPLD